MHHSAGLPAVLVDCIRREEREALSVGASMVQSRPANGQSGVCPPKLFRLQFTILNLRTANNGKLEVLT